MFLARCATVVFIPAERGWQGPWTPVLAPRQAVVAARHLQGRGDRGTAHQGSCTPPLPRLREPGRKTRACQSPACGVSDKLQSSCTVLRDKGPGASVPWPGGRVLVSFQPDRERALTESLAAETSSVMRSSKASAFPR